MHVDNCNGWQLVLKVFLSHKIGLGQVFNARSTWAVTVPEYCILFIEQGYKQVHFYHEAFIAGTCLDTMVKSHFLGALVLHHQAPADIL